MTLPAPDRKVRNVTSHEHCAACIDGWVALKGTITVAGTTYDRGRAPCRWCEQGVARIQRHPHLETNFTGADVDLPETPGRVTHPIRRPPTRLIRSIQSVPPPTPPPESEVNLDDIPF
jgi:hypothetical protein